MIIFEAGRQATKVRALWIAALFAAAVAISWTTALVVAAAAPEASDVVRARPPIGLFLSALLGIIAVSLAVYARCYVTRLGLADDGATVLVRTLGLSRDRSESILLRHVRASDYSSGDHRFATAPWWTIRVQDRMLPLFVDAQGHVHDLTGLVRVLHGGFEDGDRTGDGVCGGL